MKSPQSYPIRLFLFFLIIACISLTAQTPEEESFIENQEENDATGWMESFETLRVNPQDLNRISLETLLNFPLISPVFAKKIIEERDSRGPFYSWENFISRMLLNMSYAQILESYFYLSKGNEKIRTRIEMRSRVMRSFPESEGYGSGDYPGSPLHTYARIKATYGSRLSAGLLVEKDSGELRWNDHTVGFVVVQNSTENSEIILGHFLIEAGQGLALSGPYGSYKGSDPIGPVEKRVSGAKGYLSAAEKKAFQGAVIRKRGRLGQCLLFLSKTRLDGSLNPDGSIGSISESGYHRTASERKKENDFSETILGARVEVFFRSGSAGLTGWISRYSTPLFHQDMERYRFDFTGNDNRIVGLDWNCFRKNIHWTGEAAVSRSKGAAWISSVLADLKELDVVISCRSYDPDFQNPHASAFAASETRNERGWYMGFRAKPVKHTRIGLYFDLFRRPWRSYFVPLPARGEDLLFRLDQTIPRRFSFSIKARFRISEKMSAGTFNQQPVEILGERLEQAYRLEVQFATFRKVESKTVLGMVRVKYPETCLAEAKSENGVLAFQDLRYRHSKNIFLSARWTVFESDSYDSRLYAYENDLAGVFSVPAFYEKGAKWHVLMQWTAMKGFQLSAKYSRISHRNASSWGSGLDKIRGNHEDRAGIQLDWTF